MNLEDKPSISLTLVVDRVFDKTDYEAARKQLESYFSVGGGAAYDLSEVEAASIVVEFLIANLQESPYWLFTSVLYDVLKGLLLKRVRSGKDTETNFEFKIIIGKDYQFVYASLKTDKEDELKEALEVLQELAKPEYEGKSFQFDEESQTWKER